MQECGDRQFFVEAILGGEGQDVDAAKLMIGRLANRSLDSDRRIRVGRLPQHFEKGVRFRSSEVSLTPNAPIKRNHQLSLRQGAGREAHGMPVTAN